VSSASDSELSEKEVIPIEFRCENKYIVSDQQLCLLDRRLSTLLSKDIHQAGHAYCIRSLYFDDSRNSCMDENDAGVDLRKKYRIRIYDPSQDIMHLEIKEKVHGFTQKHACDITRKECLSLMDGLIPPLFDSRSVFNDLKLKMRISGMHPAAIIDYERSAYVSPLGNVRITFDRNISVSTCCRDFLADKPARLIPLLPTGMHVLEVKYDEFIPDYILQVIQSIKPERTVFSKYYLGRLAAQCNFSY